MNNKFEFPCEITGESCSWESIDLSTEDDYNWDLQCQDCFCWRDWSKDEFKISRELI